MSIHACNYLLWGWRLGKSSQCYKWPAARRAWSSGCAKHSPRSKPTAPLDPAPAGTRPLLYRCGDSRGWSLVYRWVDMKVQPDVPWCAVFFQPAPSRGQWLCGDLREGIAHILLPFPNHLLFSLPVTPLGSCPRHSLLFPSVFSSSPCCVYQSLFPCSSPGWDRLAPCGPALWDGWVGDCLFALFLSRCRNGTARRSVPGVQLCCRAGWGSRELPCPGWCFSEHGRDSSRKGSQDGWPSSIKQDCINRTDG